MKYIICLAMLITSPVFAQGNLDKMDVKDKAETSPDFVTGTIQDGVYFVDLKNGDTVATTFKVKFGVHGMQVKPAGAIEIGTGHHHLIVDDAAVVKAGGVKKKGVVAKDETHIHFGKGEEETELTLKPGKHTLTLQFADGAHLSYGPRWSKTIHVTVK